MVFLSAVLIRHVFFRLSTIAILTGLFVAWGAATSVTATEINQTTPATPSPAASPDAVPSPNESPGAAAPVGPGGAAPRTATPNTGSPSFGHLPIIDIIPIFTDPQFYTVPSIGTNGQPAVNPLKNSGVGYDPVDVGGTIKIPITPIISGAFDRIVEGTLNVPNARVTTAKTTTGATPYQYNVFSRDAVLVYRLDEQMKRLQIEEGMYFRHRIVGGSNTSNNPLLPTISSTEAHYGYVGLTYATGGMKWLLNSFLTLNINADTQAVDHHVACLLSAIGSVKATCPKGNTTGVIDENSAQSRVFETDQFVQLTIPVDRKHGVTLVAQDRWGAQNFYENAPFPYRYTTSQTYLLTKRFNRVFALLLRARDQWTVPGLPSYVAPNAQHNGTIDVLADFKLDTNSFH